MATKEVTRDQWRRFERTHPQLAMPPSFVNQWTPDPDSPMVCFNWYIAANYCNWLSEQDGLPRDQWCYLPNEAGAYAEGMTIPADVLDRTGYRLPTEAEWEFACRAGAVTSRSYGHSLDLLGAYACYQANNTARPERCGRLFPNDLGLFDMLGNVYEWCQDGWITSKPVRKGLYSDGSNKAEPVMEKNARFLRGGSFGTLSAFIRSADRNGDAPSGRFALNGFRPSRTYP